MKTRTFVAMAAACLTSLGASAAVTTSGCSGGSFGDACGLDELVTGGSMTVDGYRFSNFTLTLNDGTLLAAGSIRVDAIDSATGPGFSFVDVANALRSVNGGLTSNNLSFDITAVGGSALVRGATLSAAVGDINGTGSYVNVFGDLFGPGLTTFLGSLTAYCGGPTCSNATQASVLGFAGQSAISVVAGLDVGAAGGGMAQLGGLSVTLAPVPEPQAAGLFAAGLLAIGWAARRRRR